MTLTKWGLRVPCTMPTCNDDEGILVAISNQAPNPKIAQTVNPKALNYALNLKAPYLQHPKPGSKPGNHRSVQSDGGSQLQL